MPGHTEFQEYVLDQLAVAGEVRARKMFGGVGAYIDEVFCAILSGSNRFYLRVDARNQGDFEARGMQQFPGRGGAGMPYFEVPEDVLEDHELLAKWAAKARAAAQDAAKAKKPRKKRRQAPTSS